MGAFTPDARAVWGDPVDDRAVWAAHDPTALARRLRGTRLVVASGDGRPGRLDRRGRRRDPIETTVGAETRSFVARLRALRVPARTDLYGAGTHTWPYWRRELHRALPTLLAGLRGR
jgi:S-formylglutathione hydrolase FrmB